VFVRGIKAVFVARDRGGNEQTRDMETGRHKDKPGDRETGKQGEIGMGM
jgi:hypothetical protein